MKQPVQHALRILNSRVAKNIYFILFMVSISRINLNQPLWKTGYATALTLLILGQLYTNNLVLVPKLLAKRKHLIYFVLIVAITFVTALAYELIVKMMLMAHPGTAEGDVSVIMTQQVNKDFGVLAILRQTQTYFWVLLMCTFIFTMAWYIIDYTRQQKEVEAAKKKQLETELQFLKGQINPHFLFNTLNNLYGLAAQKADHTPDALLKLSSILRYMLYESDTDTVSFEKEKEVMQAYIDLELLRLPNHDNLNFSYSADSTQYVPPLLWLPVLENVFKHGTGFIADTYSIDFNCSIEKNKLRIYSRNSYNPLAQGNGLEQAKGIGLENLRQRLRILYPGKYTFTSGPENGDYVTKVEVLLN